MSKAIPVPLLALKGPEVLSPLTLPWILWMRRSPQEARR